MTKVIYSLYIDIPKDELDYQPPFYGKEEPKTHETKRQLKDYYYWLKEIQQAYANNINVEYKLFEYDDQYKEYKKWFNKKYPIVTSYNIINFYKIHLMYELAKEYDEILYLDFDVVPITEQCFFKTWDISNKGIAIMANRNSVDTSLHKIVISKENFDNIGMLSNRSPTAKYWNTRAMLLESDMSGKNDVYNTGIVGISKEQLEQLDYWNNFDDIINLMTELKNDEYSMWPEHIRYMFGWDNETIWSYKMSINNLTRNQLLPEWHHVIDKWNYIPPNTQLVHVINKNFEYMKDWYEKNYI